jgi:hypothetical protein
MHSEWFRGRPTLTDKPCGRAAEDADDATDMDSDKEAAQELLGLKNHYYAAPNVMQVFINRRGINEMVITKCNQKKYLCAWCLIRGINVYRGVHDKKKRKTESERGLMRIRCGRISQMGVFCFPMSCWHDLRYYLYRCRTRGPQPSATRPLGPAAKTSQ